MTDAAFWYPIAKVVHIGALVLWLGPSGGAWMVLMLARRESGEPNAVSHALYVGFLRMLWIEHLGFALLLASGLALLSIYGLAAIHSTWLAVKLGLVLGVVVPIELSDIWLSHKRLPDVFASRLPDAPYTDEEARVLAFYHRRFTPALLPILLAAVVVVMWLAVAKPA